MYAKKLKFNLPNGQAINVEVETTMSIESFLKQLKVRELIDENKNYEIQSIDGHSMHRTTPFGKLKISEMNIVSLDFTDDKIPEPENYEQKCACALVLDTSASMSGAPIEELNKGLQTFHSETKSDFITSRRLEIEVVTFNSQVEIKQKFDLVDNFQMPVLMAKGTSKLVDGVRKAISDLKKRKSWYKKTGQTFYRPYIILITNSTPDNDQDVSGLALEIKKEVENKNFNFFPIGIKDVNMDILNRLSCGFTARKLKEIEFVKLFQWLSNSAYAITNSDESEIIENTFYIKV